MGKYIGRESTYGIFSTQDLSSQANGTKQDFVLTYSVPDAAALLVVYSGSVLQPHADYSVINGGSEVSFDVAPQSGFSLYVTYLGKELSGSHNFTYSDGTAAAPGLSFADDLNTGIFRAAADTLGISTGGTERVRVQPTGAVRFVPLAADPGTGQAGDVYYNSTTNKLRVYNGTSWVDLH